MKLLKLKYKEEIEKLCEDGDTLLEELKSNEDAFRKRYQTWYSFSLTMIKLLLPARILDFEKYYKCDNSKTLSRTNFAIENYLLGDYILGTSIYPTPAPKFTFKVEAIAKFQQQLAIVNACKNSIDSVLFNLETIMLGDLYDSELDAAVDLNKHKFYRAAGAIAGVVLEKHLKKVCKNHNISIEKLHPSIGDLTSMLYSEKIYLVTTHNHIISLASLRSLCDHDKENDPTREDVDLLIDGVKKIIHSVY